MYLNAWSATFIATKGDGFIVGSASPVEKEAKFLRDGGAIAEWSKMLLV